jgi:hypothetical protein
MFKFEFMSLRGGEMRRWFIPKVVLIVIILSILACGGGTSGSVVGSTRTCEKSGLTGACEGHINKLSGTYGLEVKNDRLRSDDTIDVEIEVFIGEGNLNVSIVSPEGNISSVQVLPNRPKKLVGQVAGDDAMFEITLEAVEGDVQSILWTVSYRIIE